MIRRLVDEVLDAVAFVFVGTKTGPLAAWAFERILTRLRA